MEVLVEILMMIQNVQSIASSSENATQIVISRGSRKLLDVEVAKPLSVIRYYIINLIDLPVKAV
jgi:hypothetical protein